MSLVSKNMKDGTVKIKDNVAESITLIVEEGDFSYSESHPVRNIMDRGALSHMREGNEEPVTGSFTLKFIEMIKQTSASDPSPYEALKGTGGASAWATTNTDGGDVFTTDIDLEIADVVSGNENERISLAKVRATKIDFKEGDEYDTLAFEFQAFQVEPAVEKYS